MGKRVATSNTGATSTQTQTEEQSQRFDPLQGSAGSDNKEYRMTDTTIPTSEVLYRAADLIEKNGWTTGSGGWNGSPSDPLCLEGALMAASGLRRGDPLDFLAYYTSCPAYSAVAGYLGRDPWPKVGPIADALWQWNDAHDRTAEEVIATLRAAAVIEAAKENTETRESVTA